MANIFRTDIDPDAFLHSLQNVLDSLSGQLKVVIGLSGGSLIHEICAIFEKINFDWTRAVFIFADERKVPFNDDESTFGQYDKVFVSKFPDRIKCDQFVIIDPSLSVDECASNYEWLLKKCDGIKLSGDGFPIIDLLLLGIGPDGHTCSLFPDHRALKEQIKWVVPIIDSPKPPSERVTLSLPVINHSKNVIFLAKGTSKATIIKEVLSEDSALPAAQVKPKNGRVYWVLDVGSATLIS